MRSHDKIILGVTDWDKGLFQVKVLKLCWVSKYTKYIYTLFWRQTWVYAAHVPDYEPAPTHKLSSYIQRYWAHTNIPHMQFLFFKPSQEMLSLLFIELSLVFRFPNRRKLMFYQQLEGLSLTWWETGSVPCAASHTYNPPTYLVRRHWAALDRYLRDKKWKVYIKLPQGRL